MTKCINHKDDAMGQALMDYQKGLRGAALIVGTSVADDEPYDVSYFFRSFDEMPELEQKALELAKGDILDVGAGTGIHSLALAQMNKSCTSIDISELSVEVMKLRGVSDAHCVDFYKIENQKYDTLLFLMNGIGLVETLDGFNAFFKQCRKLLRPGGQILFDSSDLIYLFEEEDGSFLIEFGDKYYGEVDFRIEYKEMKAKPFPWLFVDFDNMANMAEKNGFEAEMILNGSHYDYLARLTLKLP